MVEESQKTEQEIKLEQAFDDISCLFWTEIKKDLPFFGCSGFVVIYLSRVEAFFRQLFPNCDLGSLTDELLSGIISFSNYGLLMLGLMIIGSIANILYCFKKEYVWLDNMIKHVEYKFTQLISVTISFVLGVTLVALLHTIFTDTLTGVLLAVLSVFFITNIFVVKYPENRFTQLTDAAKWYIISVTLIVFLHGIFTDTLIGVLLFALGVVFIMYIFFFSMMVYIVTRRIEPLKVRQIWDKRRSSAFVLTLVIAVIFLVLTGCKILVDIFALTFLLLVLGYKGYCLWRERQQQQV